MKKSRKMKILIAAAAGAVLLVTVTWGLAAMGRRIIESDYQTAVIAISDFQPFYQTPAAVTVRQTAYYIPGTLFSCPVQKGQTVSRGTVLAEYYDAYGSKKKLLSRQDGLVMEIEPSAITLGGSQRFLTAYLPLDILNKCPPYTVGLFTSQSRQYAARLLEVSPLVSDSEKQRAGVVFSAEQADGLLIGQSGTLTVQLEKMTAVLTVDRSAVFSDDQGSFVADEQWISDLSHPDKYRHDVALIAADEKTAVIEGIGLESRQVIIWTAQLEQLWQLN